MGVGRRRRRRACRNGRGGPSPRGAGAGADRVARGGGPAGRRRPARPRGEAQEAGELPPGEDRQRGERRAEPERVGGQQQVLHGREDRGVHRLGVGQAGVAADDDQHRCGGDAAHRPAVDVTQEGGGEALLLEGPGAALPHARRQLADRGAQPGIPDDDEHEGLAVLRARRVRRRRQDARRRSRRRRRRGGRSAPPAGCAPPRRSRDRGGPRRPMVSSRGRGRPMAGGLGAAAYGPATFGAASAEAGARA